MSAAVWTNTSVWETRVSAGRSPCVPNLHVTPCRQLWHTLTATQQAPCIATHKANQCRRTKRSTCSFAAVGGVISSRQEEHHDHMRRAVGQLRQVVTYKQMEQWLARHIQEAQRDTGYIHPDLCVAAVAKVVQEVEVQYWEQLGSKTFEECVALNEIREAVFAILLQQLEAALPDLSLPIATYCADAVASLGDAPDEGLFRVLCQMIVRNSQSQGKDTPDTATNYQSGTIPAVLDCEPNDVESVLKQLCGALGTASYYSPVTMQLIAKEVIASLPVCNPGVTATVLQTFMLLQHYDRPMLNAIGVHLLRPSPSSPDQQQSNKSQLLSSPSSTLNIARLEPLEAAQVAAAFAFFNVQNPAFYQVLLARMSAAKLDELSVSDVTSIYMACQLMPEKVIIPHSISTLLSAGNEAYGDEVLEDLTIRRDFVCMGGAVHEEARVQEMMKHRAWELLCYRQLRTLLQQTTPAEDAGQPPQVFMPASPHAPWFWVPMAVPGHDMEGTMRQVALSIMPHTFYCKNMPTRMLGSAQATLRCLQRLGWPVWPVSVEQWHEQVVDAAGVAGLADDYEEASLVWAKVVTEGISADPVLAGKVQRMTADLGNWVQSGLSGAIILHTNSGGKEKESPGNV